ncbi:DUF2784 family protein [Algoriphagus hitonicola]|nr:DUF2784 family protein [Algoriphagus hitonicola]
MLHSLNILFFVFHGVLILFNLFGWLVERFRFWNLITLSATAGSWFILGIWKGWGYCPCTDWHWEVREQLGLPIETNSYIDFLLRQLLGLELPIQVVDGGTLIIFLICFVASIWVNFKKINLIKKE